MKGSVEREDEREVKGSVKWYCYMRWVYEGEGGMRSIYMRGIQRVCVVGGMRGMYRWYEGVVFP